MLRRFTTAGTLSDLPLKMARGATARGPERIPGMTAVAGPAKTARRQEETLRTTDQPAVETADSGGVRASRPLAARRGHPAAPETAGVRRVRLLRLDNSRPRNARQGCGEFDGGEEAKVVVRDLLQQVRSINP